MLVFHLPPAALAAKYKHFVFVSTTESFYEDEHLCNTLDFGLFSHCGYFKK